MTLIKQKREVITQCEVKTDTIFKRRVIHNSCGEKIMNYRSDIQIKEAYQLLQNHLKSCPENKIINKNAY